ncbi:hypothetical protein B0H11DRAFT_2266386 [Mycena galericulata]|nr:hypothetical protein B0H11DRAFT_2266386 [Mycena galericulata]
MSDQCALNADGSLRDASEIDFYESESDTKTLPASSAELRRGTWKRDTDRLAESLAAQKADDDGNPFVEVPKRRARASTARVKAVPESVSDQEDDDYDLPDLVDASDSEDSDGEMEIDNDEIASFLLSKTVPGRSKSANSKPQTRGKTTSAAKRKHTSESASAPAPKRTNRATVEEVEDEDDPPAKPATKNPIYLFYEVVSRNSVGYAGAPGDKHYKCFHGNRQIITVSKASRSNLTKLIRHLKNNFPIMHRLYLALYTRGQPPTEEEVKLAQGAIPVDGTAAKEYLGKVETTTSNIIKGLEQQAKKVHGDFDQATFDRLLAEWIVACDQPFEVEKPEFIRLMEYTHHGSTLDFRIPGRDSWVL